MERRFGRNLRELAYKSDPCCDKIGIHHGFVGSTLLEVLVSEQKVVNLTIHEWKSFILTQVPTASGPQKKREGQADASATGFLS
jgi:hypothetical protein